MRELQLQVRPGTAAFSKGQQRVLKILQSARDLMIAGGYHNLTMRKVAAEAGISVGNLSYYYPNKEHLLRDLLDQVIESYMWEFDKIKEEAGVGPEQQFVAIIRFIIDDLGTQETTNFFPELWALSNHDSHAAERMDALYIKARLVLNELIEVLNPSLNEPEREQLALFISASMEGLTPFAGFNKPWESKRDNIANIAAISFLNLVKTIRNEDIDQLR
ncbi:TetR/AcrR family transcriptional regulator [Motiliproteus sp.]|uniref:TetR/AcrR family transcriptional regulator n=1 Tax=Motiliproteus sp. TaxID=1898955 RepID=UPI003BA9B24F